MQLQSILEKRGREYLPFGCLVDKMQRKEHSTISKIAPESPWRVTKIGDISRCHL